MSSANAGGNGAAIEIDALSAIRRLAAKGAFAVPVEAASGAGDFAVFSDRNGGSQPLARIPAAAFAWARRKSWVEAEPDTGRYRISADGVKALRRASSSPAAAGSKIGADKKPKGKVVATIGGAREGSLAW